MKNIKRIFVLALCFVMAFSSLATGVSAAESNTIKILNYNVAGLPIDVDVPVKQSAIGEYINENDYDIVAVQEDFTFHSYLADELTNYPYQTIHSGSIPWGDGLNVFSKSKIYNESRTEWDSLSGVLDGGNDALTPKGYLYSVIELEDGVYLDFYVIHCDAYGDAGSVAARTDNFRQLSEAILARETDRPVIVAGDFNAFLHEHNYSKNGDCGMYEYLIQGAGMKDGWVEQHNNGDYNDFSYYVDKYGSGYNSTCGVWDSIERVAYKNGGGVELDITKLEYVMLSDENLGELSDHPALDLEFTYTKTSDFVENSDPLAVKKENKKESIFRRIYYFLRDLVMILSDWDALMELLGGLGK